MEIIQNCWEHDQTKRLNFENLMEKIFENEKIFDFNDPFVIQENKD
jgi:hypothetical protein